MSKSIESPPSVGRKRAPRRWLRRIGWMLLIWSASVAALGAVALGLRLLMRLIGMTP
jgi:hypothetical protein